MASTLSVMANCWPELGHNAHTQHTPTHRFNTVERNKKVENKSWVGHKLKKAVLFVMPLLKTFLISHYFLAAV